MSDKEPKVCIVFADDTDVINVRQGDEIKFITPEGVGDIPLGETITFYWANGEPT